MFQGWGGVLVEGSTDNFAALRLVAAAQVMRGAISRHAHAAADVER
jgi:hypothetical protein